MFKLAIFDIDGVLNPAGCPVQPESMAALKALETHDVKISYASGKHPWYITGGLIFSGLLRKDTIIVGESGGHVFFPNQKQSMLYTTYIEDMQILRKIFKEDDLMNECWEEPKETLFSLFPRKREIVPLVAHRFEGIIRDNNLQAYVISHVDAVDALQMGLSKEIGLSILSEYLGISMEEMIAFGDGMNDVEMLSTVGFPVAVANAEEPIKTLVKKRGGYITSQPYGRGVLEATDYIIESLLT
ncbi:MAG: HAD-IIB family hydrolase [Theionarchaea archaeon]|nr:HAD-IIB family hydrolase [Theionarchaea archaeon]